MKFSQSFGQASTSKSMTMSPRDVSNRIDMIVQDVPEKRGIDLHLFIFRRWHRAAHSLSTTTSSPTTTSSSAYAQPPNHRPTSPSTAPPSPSATKRKAPCLSRHTQTTPDHLSSRNRWQSLDLTGMARNGKLDPIIGRDEGMLPGSLSLEICHKPFAMASGQGSI